MKTAVVRSVGVFGGSFNPPHAAHVQVAHAALEMHGLDEVWFVPVLAHPAGKLLAPYEDRVAMCELVAADPRLRVSRAEKDTAAHRCVALAHTVEVLEHLDRTLPDTALNLVIGSDLLAGTTRWRRWGDVTRLANLVVIDRGATQPISSTWVREQLARGSAELEASVSGAVLRYIASNGLYATSRAA